MAEAVGDVAWLAAMLRFEAALAAAQSNAGIIPVDAATAIRAACDPAQPERIARQAGAHPAR